MIINAKTPIPDIKLKWVDITERKPEPYYCTYLKCIYGNGNQVSAIGWLNDESVWEIEWSDDHPMPEDIKFWLEEK